MNLFVLFLLLQNCPKEVSKNGISVIWPESPPNTIVESDPICYNNETIVKRYCNNTEWVPLLPDLEPCLTVVENFNLSSCPPGFQKISENNNEYCYEISETSAWDFPCFRSGGASVITDLSAEEIESLMKSLNKMNISRYYWLPAQRQKLFNPVVWYIPGPNWGQVIYSSTLNSLRVQTSVLKNCLILDIEQQLITTETCNKEYPSLCFYLNDIFYPAQCPKGYHAFRFKADNGTCYGIELSDDTNGLTFEDFLATKCYNPMGDSKYTDNNYLNRFIFVKIAELYNLPDDAWCWYKTTTFTSIDIDENVTYLASSAFEGVINSQGSVSLMNMLFHLPCMACEAEIVYQETLMSLEYNNVETKLYLTVYFPSGLWKYDDHDKGIQCFSDAKGFVKVVDINDIPLIELEETLQIDQDPNSTNVEKIVYIVDLITQRSAQYWCEGHTNEFSLVATNKIIATAPGNKLHVFALILKLNVSDDNDASPDSMEYVSSLISNMTSVFEAEKVLLMDVFEYTLEYMLVLMHLHVAVHEMKEDKSSDLIATYNTLKEKAETKLLEYNITFLNITSSMYCLPSMTIDVENDVVLDWDLTEIGHIASAKQFCLQDNGLPVTRRCGGSYLLGGIWEDINGFCNKNLSPSTTTAFLYNFVQEQTVFENMSSRFLTDGLSFVLNDIEIIIPADIYYLAISLQQVLNIAHDNQSSVDIGDIKNIAWVMDRILELNNSYLRLAQSLNSTNVILDSINKFIEMLARTNKDSNFKEDTVYQLSVQPQFILQISYPEFNNVTGIALVRTSESDKFTDMIIRPLYKNSTVEDVLRIENLEIATWLPTHVLDTLRKLTNDTIDEKCLNKEDIHIVVNVYHNHAIFQELDVTKHRVNSRIVGLSIPGFMSNLEHSVPIVFKEINTTNFNKFCGYWDFNTNKVGQNPGFWTNEGCYFVDTIEQMSICKCYHMTHFGQLIDIGTIVDPEKKHFNKNHSTALNIITLIGSFLSLFGVIGIWITASVFKTWRKKAGTKVLLQLSTAIAVPLIIIIIFNLDNSIFVEHEGRYVVAEHMKIICVILGSLLHYSILTSFVWMLITAILQFIRYVRVLGVCRPSRFMIKFTMIGWGLPFIPVIFTLALDYENYIPNTSSTTDLDKGPICYPNGIYFIFGVLVPVAIILLINVILFALVIHAISRGPDGKMRATDIDLVGSQLRLSIFLFFLIGLTWFFGIFSFTGNLLFSYLFCLTSTMQGFVLFIYFVICDPSTRNMWITLMKPQFSMSTSRNSSISSS